MKKHALIVLCAVVLFPGLPLRAQAPSIFEPMVERRQGPPIWISAQAVADAEKVINLDLIDSRSLQGLVEKQWHELRDRIPAQKSRTGEKPSVMTIPPSECKWTLFSTGQDHRGEKRFTDTDTLSALADYSQSILRGTIRSIDFGFDGGVPGSLLGVEVMQAIKGSAPAPLFYVLYPVVRFRIGALHFCNAEKGFEPRPGDQILLFDYTGPVDRDHLLFAPNLNQMIFQSQKGALFLPRHLRNTPGMNTFRTLDEVVGKLSFSTTSSPRSRGRAR